MKKTTITPMLLRSRSKDSKYQVVIRINHDGRYYLNVGDIYASENEWDKSHNRLKPKYPNAAILNKIIADKVAEIETRLYSLSQSGKPFTAKDLTLKTNDTSLVFKDLVEAIINYRNLRLNSAKNYHTAAMNVSKYLGKDGVLLTELNAPTLRKFAQYLKSDLHMADNTIRNMLTLIGCVWKYAIEQHLVDRNLYPYDEWRYTYEYKQQPHHIALSEYEMNQFDAYYVNRYLSVDLLANSYSYSDMNIFQKSYSKELCLSLFLIGYRMQGLALCDLLKIKRNDLEFIERGETRYMVVKGMRRQKTNVAVNIVVEMDDMFTALITPYLQWDGYIFPPYRQLKPNESVTSKTAVDILKLCTRHISDRVSAIAKEIGIDKRITYYMVRHTFATIYMSKGNGNIMALASMLGHNVLATTNYIKELDSVDALIESKRGMFD